MKRRIRVTLGAWMVIVAGLCVGPVVVILVVVPGMQKRNARATCTRNLTQINWAKRVHPVVLSWSDWEVSCPLATDDARAFTNSYDIGNATTPPTCRIRPEEHVLP